MKMENLINKHTDQLFWGNISRKIDVMQIDEDLFDHLSYFWNWDHIFVYQSVSQDFYNKWKNYGNWFVISLIRFGNESLQIELDL